METTRNSTSGTTPVDGGGPGSDISFFGKAYFFFWALIPLLAVCTVLWQAWFPGKIYYCTDEIGFDFLMPNGMVHYPVPFEHIIISSSMGDEILVGWTLLGLRLVWLRRGADQPWVRQSPLDPLDSTAIASATNTAG